MRENSIRNRTVKGLSKNEVKEIIPDAVDNFLKNGGKIKKIESLDFDKFMEVKPDQSNADYFLMGV